MGNPNSAVMPAMACPMPGREKKNVGHEHLSVYVSTVGQKPTKAGSSPLSPHSLIRPTHTGSYTWDIHAVYTVRHWFVRGAFETVDKKEKKRKRRLTCGVVRVWCGRPCAQADYYLDDPEDVVQLLGNLTNSGISAAHV